MVLNKSLCCRIKNRSKVFLGSCFSNQNGETLPGIMVAVIITGMMMWGIMFAYESVSIAYKRADIYDQMQVKTNYAMQRIVRGIIKKRASQSNDTDNDYFSYGIQSGESCTLDYLYTGGNNYNYILFSGAIPPTAQVQYTGDNKYSLRWQVEIFSRDGYIWHVQKDHNIESYEEKIFPIDNTIEFYFTNHEDLRDHEYFVLKDLTFEYVYSPVDIALTNNMVNVIIEVQENLPDYMLDDMPNNYVPRTYKCEKLVYLYNSTRIREGSGSSGS